MIDERTDPGISRAIWDRLTKVHAQPVLMRLGEQNQKEKPEIKDQDFSGPSHGSAEEPPKILSLAMRGSDAVFRLSPLLPLHSAAALSAIYEYGARVIGILSPTLDEFASDVNLIDPDTLRRINGLVEKTIGNRTQVRVTADNGTDFEVTVPTLEIGGQPGSGNGYEPGTFVHWPQGEILFCPVEEGTARGKIVFDVVSLIDRSLVKESVEFLLENGWVKRIKGDGAAANSLGRQYEKYRYDAYFAEVAIWTNPVKPPGEPLSSAIRKPGAAYFGFGASKVAGYRFWSHHHRDQTPLKPTIFVDDELIVRDGKVLAIEELRREGKLG